MVCSRRIRAQKLLALPLLYACAAALHQKDQNQAKEYTSNHSDHQSLSIEQLPLQSMAEHRFKRFRHQDHCRPQYNQEQRWKDEQNQWKYKLD